MTTGAIVYEAWLKRCKPSSTDHGNHDPQGLEALVRRKVEEGHYGTEDEVVADALRLMQARDEVAEIKRTRLKDAIDRGYEDAATGKTIRLAIEHG